MSPERKPPKRRSGQSKHDLIGPANRAALDLARLGQPAIDYQKVFGPQLDYGKLFGSAIDYGALARPAVDYAALIGPRIDYGVLATPKIDFAKLFGPRLDLAKLLGPQFAAIKLAMPTIDVARIATPLLDFSKLLPKVDLGRLISTTLIESDAFEAVRSAVAATSFVVADIDVASLAGDMSVADLLGDVVELPSDLGVDVRVTDLLGDQLQAGALLGDELDLGSFDATADSAADPQESALVAAIIARVDELERELGDQLKDIKDSLGWRRQAVILILSAFVSLVAAIGMAQLAPSLMNPDGGAAGGAQVASQVERPPTHPAETAMGQRVAHINIFLQERLAARGLKEVRAVEAARWLDEAGLLRDSSSRPGAPLRRMLRAGVITGAEQRPNQPHGRWFILAV